MTDHELPQPREGCVSCQRLIAQNQRLWRRIQELERQDRFRQWQMAQLRQEVAELAQKLNRNSRNSSLPPSANPPSAPPATAKEPTGKKIGAQRGHPGVSSGVVASRAGQ